MLPWIDLFFYNIYLGFGIEVRLIIFGIMLSKSLFRDEFSEYEFPAVKS
jgi:hypothetical protein